MYVRVSLLLRRMVEACGLLTVVIGVSEVSVAWASR